MVLIGCLYTFGVQSLKRCTSVFFFILEEKLVPLCFLASTLTVCYTCYMIFPQDQNALIQSLSTNPEYLKNKVSLHKIV